jgi:hypothetical protein
MWASPRRLSVFSSERTVVSDKDVIAWLATALEVAADDAFESVFRLRLSADTLEKNGKRMGAAADEFLQNRPARTKSKARL